MKNSLYLFLIIGLFSCSKKDLKEKMTTTVNVTTTNAVTGEAIDQLECQIIETGLDYTTPPEVIQSDLTSSGSVNFSFKKRSFKTYKLNVESSDYILLEQKIPGLELGKSNNINLHYAEKANLRIGLTHEFMPGVNDYVKFKIIYNDFTTYTFEGIPSSGKIVSGETDNSEYFNDEVPAGSYTIEWESFDGSTTTTGSESFIINAGDEKDFELVY